LPYSLNRSLLARTAIRLVVRAVFFPLTTKFLIELGPYLHAGDAASRISSGEG
jgi:hypothetical protein